MIRYYLGIYKLFLKNRFKILLEYRMNFFVGIASVICIQAAQLIAVWIVMEQVPTLNGWSYDEILLIYGFLALSRSVSHMFADNLWALGHIYIRTGQFDRFLVRPVNPLFHLLAERFCQDGIGNFIVGLCVLIKSLIALNMHLTILDIIYIFAAVISGGLIFIAVNVITSTSAFWIIDSVPITRAVYETHEFAKYPLSFYHQSIAVLMTWGIPYGFTSFYPASHLLKHDLGMLVYAPPVVALLLCLFAHRIWMYGLRHYSSTGS